MQAARTLPLAMLPVILWGQTGTTVEGSVIDSVTRVGIKDAEVMLQRTSRAGGANYRATTDASGAFRIEDVPPDLEADPAL